MREANAGVLQHLRRSGGKSRAGGIAGEQRGSFAEIKTSCSAETWSLGNSFAPQIVFSLM